jgi:hypothetical protein
MAKATSRMISAVRRLSLGSMTPHSDRGRVGESRLRAIGWPGAAVVSGEAQTLNPFETVGWGALLMLPFLILASLIAHAPLAGPAALALGYLLAARGPASRDSRASLTPLAIVLASLVIWTIFVALWAAKPFTLSGWTSATLAPAFAAAPALVSRFCSPRRAPVPAGEVVGWLDRLAPREMVLIIDASGALLAGTRAALALFKNALSEMGATVGETLSVEDRAALLQALASAARGAGPVNLILPSLVLGKGAGRAVRAEILPAGSGLFALKIELAEPAVHANSERESVGAVTASLIKTDQDRFGECCDLGDVLVFALERVRPMLIERRMAVQVHAAPSLLAACDRQSARRIVTALLECALAESGTGASLDLSARAIKGAALIRVTARDDHDETARLLSFQDAAREADLAAAIDVCGGTLMIEGAARAVVASVRLGLADIGGAAMLHGAA